MFEAFHKIIKTKNDVAHFYYPLQNEKMDQLRE